MNFLCIVKKLKFDSRDHKLSAETVKFSYVPSNFFVHNISTVLLYEMCINSCFYADMCIVCIWL